MESILKIFDLTLKDAPMIFLGSIFLLTLWSLLSRSLFEPYLKVLSERERLTTGAQSAASAVRQEADALTAKGAEKVMLARVKAQEARLEAITRAQREATLISEKGELDAQEFVRTSRLESARSSASMREQALREVDDMVHLVVSKIETSSSGVH